MGKRSVIQFVNFLSDYDAVSEEAFALGELCASNGHASEIYAGGAEGKAARRFNDFRKYKSKSKPDGCSGTSPKTRFVTDVVGSGSFSN